LDAEGSGSRGGLPPCRVYRMSHHRGSRSDKRFLGRSQMRLGCPAGRYLTTEQHLDDLLRQNHRIFGVAPSSWMIAQPISVG
jgi:hypothetical protein